MLTLDAVLLEQDGFRLSADWSVPQGARVAVLGPSGAGKSTLLAAIAGFLAPVSGRILWAGRDMTLTPPGDRPLSILFQDGNLFAHLTAAQNLGLGLDPRLKLTPDQHAQVAQALAQVGLADKAARRPAALSGGEQSRVALARALLRARPLLLLDEPFAALGPALKTEMLALVDAIATRTGATVLMVTHDPADARRLCPLTVLVAEGIAHAPAATAALLDAPPPVLAAYLGR
ncbi:MAG: ATP-binding cassette domain-containing protein [Gemmobacter sp.]|uniref:thiamine ABC transporter ATP-binding protein n=1 Tax=Gemmobacter sp. TaxID=1898957 RepID=UPI00391C8D13